MDLQDKVNSNPKLYFRTSELAAYLKVTPITVAKRVLAGTLPKPIGVASNGKRGRPSNVWLRSAVK